MDRTLLLTELADILISISPRLLPSAAHGATSHDLLLPFACRTSRSCTSGIASNDIKVPSKPRAKSRSPNCPTGAAAAASSEAAALNWYSPHVALPTRAAETGAG